MQDTSKGRLTIISGPETGKRISFTEIARVGRDKRFELEISDADTGVHRKPHFIIRNRNGVFRLESDYENDTRVNGHVVKNAQLRHGDEIQIGFRTTIRFEDESLMDLDRGDSADPPTDLTV